MTPPSVLQRFAKEVEKLLGPSGLTLFQKRRDQSLVRRVDELAASMRGFQKEPGNLKEYSPRLSGFKADTLGNELEVPGEPEKLLFLVVDQSRNIGMECSECSGHMLCLRILYSTLKPFCLISRPFE